MSHVLTGGDLRANRPVVDRAEGVWVYDTAGKKYLDATGGAVVVGIGHGVQEVLDAMSNQARRVAFAYYNQFANAPQQELAQALAEFLPGDLNHVFFSSGGSEAVESAIKLARSYHVARGENRHKIIGRWRSYHGNTLGALSASGHEQRRKSYDPYTLDFPHIAPPYCYRCFLRLTYPTCALACARELEREILHANPDEVAAFIAEPVTGSSAAGMVPPDGYYGLIREICDRYGILFISDEVLCGMGRTGRNSALEHWGVVPDILVAAKGVSSGYAPLGITVTTTSVYETLLDAGGYFEHGYTYSGHPVACAAGLAVLNYIRAHHLVDRAAESGVYLLERLRNELTELPYIGEISGLGLLAGIEIVRNRQTREPFPATERVSARIVRAAFERGLIVLPGSGGQANGYDGDRLEIAPPLVITHDEIDIAIAILGDAMRAVFAELTNAAGAQPTDGRDGYLYAS